MKIYIAFSIHNTNCFIVATKVITDIEYIRMCRNGYSRAESRRLGVSTADGQKMHWNKLLKRDGKPHTSPSWVLRRVNQLERVGWTIIGKEAFIKHHYESNSNG